MNTAALIFLSLSSLTVSSAFAEECGFIGKVTTVWGDDGRTMKLVVPYGFRDSKGTIWSVPEGAEVDGASIPRFAWALIGGPFAGKYRNASVTHDYFCDSKSKSWQATHQMFFDACICAGVPVLKAKVMYAAVWAGGPRWKRPSIIRLMSKGIRPESASQPEIREVQPPGIEDFEAIQAWIEKENPDLQEIAREIESRSALRNAGVEQRNPELPKITPFR